MTKVVWDVSTGKISRLPEKKYSGAILDKDCKEVYIKEVIYNKPATIILWSDKTKTICKCSENDTYNKEMGLLVCIYKKMFGSKVLKQLLSDWTSEQESMFSHRVTLRDVMQKNK